MNLKIPRIIHQTYRNNSIPSEFIKFRNSWIEKHPDWEYRLWTDGENRTFIKNHYNWFLSTYDNYSEEIMRIDAIRYFLLDYFGGLYVDLDFECLKNIEPLLEGNELVIGKEPKAHSNFILARERGIKNIICNAFMASTPKNKFWSHLFEQIEENKNKSGVLDATGPFFLSKTFESYSENKNIALIDPEIIYPITNQQSWSQFLIENKGKKEVIEKIHAVHHWKGSWIKARPKMNFVNKTHNLIKKYKTRAEYFIDRKKMDLRANEMDNQSIVDYWKVSDSVSSKIETNLFLNGKKLSSCQTDKKLLLSNSYINSDPPLISCLMVTQNRYELAKTAVKSFLNQTYSKKELIILDDGNCNKLQDWIVKLQSDKIIYHKLPEENKKLGELRNIGVGNCAGKYITQWDDDDFSHPERIEFQYLLLDFFSADVCFLNRHQILFPFEEKIIYSKKRIWEGSFLCRKKLLKKYPNISRGEDTPVTNNLFLNSKSVLADFPSLYTYFFHEKNTFGKKHFEKHIKQATNKFKGHLFYEKLDKILEENKLEKDEFYKRYKLNKKREEIYEPYIKKKYLSKKREKFSEILILSPAKNAKNCLSIFFSNLEKLSYPHEKISLGVLESDSEDGTFEALKEKQSDLQKMFNSVDIIKHDFRFKIDGPRWEPLKQLKRRSIIAKSRNILLSHTLTNQKWVLWIDIDVADWPENIIEILLDSEKDIVVPSCVGLNGEPFDLNSFKFNQNATSIKLKNFLLNGIMQPPYGLGRTYLTELKDYENIEIDSVGGTMLMINADLHREGLIFPTFPYKYFIETEGLAMMAKDMGYKCWGLPNVEILHPKG